MRLDPSTTVVESGLPHAGARRECSGLADVPLISPARFVQRLWRDQKSISIDFNNYSPDNICTETYLECLEEERIDKCIPSWENPEAHDVSEYAAPGTVLHDAYVVHAIGNEDAVLEKLHEKIYEIEEIAWEKGRAFDVDLCKRKYRLMPQPRAEIFLQCIH